MGFILTPSKLVQTTNFDFIIVYSIKKQLSKTFENEQRLLNCIYTENK